MYLSSNPQGTIMRLIKKIRSRVQAQLDPFLYESLYPILEKDPFVIYDVGAEGEVYQPFFIQHDELTKIYGFEPVAVSFNKLQRKYANKSHIEIRNIALCDRDGPIDFYLNTSTSVTHSSLISHDAIGLTGDKIQVEGARLDSVPKRYGFPAADFIKLDTEGSELMILQSSEDMLKRTIMGVWVEISFWRKGTSGAVFNEIDKFLCDHGFILYDMQVNRSHYSGIGGKKDKLRSGDALYLRDFSTFVDVADREHITASLFKLIALCVNWRYLNYAVELLDYGRRQMLVSDMVFKKLVLDWSSVMDLSDKIPRFPLRTSLAYFFDVCAFALHGPARKAVPRTFNSIGNVLDLTVRGKHRSEARISNPVFQDNMQSIIKTVELSLDAAKD